MKKIIFIILFTVFLDSCSSDNLDIFTGDTNSNPEIESIYIASENDSKKHIEQIYQSILKKNPDFFNFENSNSDLFIKSEENKVTKNSNQTYIVQGYDKKQVLKKYSLSYSFPRQGLTQGVPYYTELCEYVKYVEIPKGYSIAIPSPKPPIMIMSVPKSSYNPNMGYIPDTFNFREGYLCKYISTSGSKDKYAFITHVEEITKNLQNNRALNPIVYNPNGVTNPSTFEFTYQIVNLSWD